MFRLFSGIREFLGTKRFPNLSQWLRIFELLTKKEKIAFLIFFILFLGSSLLLITDFYYKNTEIQPDFGGNYIEGVVGLPRFINPIYAASNDVDLDLIELIFSGLMKYNPEGEIVPDLIQDFEIKEEGKVYEVYLKENIFWQDGKKLTAEDVIFTIQTIQNPDYKSPLRANWLGVKVEKIDDFKVRFKLKNPYAAFLERLTLKIIPKHIWEKISPENFPLSIYNLQPIGSGPYQFQNLNQNKEGQIISIDLKRFKKYFGKKPYLSKISFRFFDQPEDLIQAAKRGEIDGFSVPINLVEKSDLENIGFQKFSFSWPRYFGLFFNPKQSPLLAEKRIRQALNFGTNKEEIVEKIFLSQANVVDSPILPQVYKDFQPPLKTYSFDPQTAQSFFQQAGFTLSEDGKLVKEIREEFIEFKSDLRVGSRGEEVKALQKCLALDPEVYPEGKITGYFGSATKKAVIKFQEKYWEEILKPWGFKNGTGIVSKTTRKKLNEICRKPPKLIFLKFILITGEDQILKQMAEILKDQWKNLGVEIEIKTYPHFQLAREIIKPRNYEILLFGQVLGIIPDPYPFWHSSQKKDPGLNLANYQNKKVDKLLAEARITLEPKIRKEKYEAFQDILIEDAPAIFLCSPDYVYWISVKIKGIETGLIPDPAKRFTNIENWYINTKRVWKFSFFK